MKLPEPIMTFAAVILTILGVSLLIVILYFGLRTRSLPTGLLIFPVAFLVSAPTAWGGLLNRLQFPVVGDSGLAWHRGWRGAIDWFRYPFSRITIRLEAAEVEILYGRHAPERPSSLKTLLRKLRHQTNQKTYDLNLTRRDAKRIRHLAFRQTKSSSQQRASADFLRQAFGRSLGEDLNGFTDLFRKFNHAPAAQRNSAG
jgi:hypothetical protein